jgi:hypothetical protein
MNHSVIAEPGEAAGGNRGTGTVRGKDGAEGGHGGVAGVQLGEGWRPAHRPEARCGQRSVIWVGTGSRAADERSRILSMHMVACTLP